LGFFQGSLNSGDWADDETDKNTSRDEINNEVRIIEDIMPE